MHLHSSCFILFMHILAAVSVRAIFLTRAPTFINVFKEIHPSLLYLNQVLPNPSNSCIRIGNVVYQWVYFLYLLRQYFILFSVLAQVSHSSVLHCATIRNVTHLRKRIGYSILSYYYLTLQCTAQRSPFIVLYCSMFIVLSYKNCPLFVETIWGYASDQPMSRIEIQWKWEIPDNIKMALIQYNLCSVKVILENV